MRERRSTPAYVVGSLAALLVACTGPAGAQQSASSLARSLEPLAAAAARQTPVSPLRPGEYRHLRWRETMLVTNVGPDGAFTRVEYRTSERWARHDGSGRWRAMCEASVFVGPRDRARWRAAGSPPDAICGAEDRPARAGELEPGVPLADALEALPTDAGHLETRMRAAAAPSRPRLTDGEMFALLGELLQVPEAPPRLRAGLIRVLARLGGVEPVGRVADPVGRPGIAIVMRLGSLHRELIFAPRTSDVLAERTVTGGRLDWADARPGRVLAWVAYLESDDVGAIPAGPERYRPTSR